MVYQRIHTCFLDVGIPKDVPLSVEGGMRATSLASATIEIVIDRIDTGHSHISILDEIEVAIEPDIFPTWTRPTRVEAS